MVAGDGIASGLHTFNRIDSNHVVEGWCGQTMSKGKRDSPSPEFIVQEIKQYMHEEIKALKQEIILLQEQKMRL